MKKCAVQFVAIFVFLFFVLVACRAVAGVGLKVSASIWKPRIVCNEATFDFGIINNVNSNPAHEFVIYNKGSRDLLIKKVVVGCGSCVEVVDFPKEPIASKNSGVIKLKLLTDSISGKVTKEVLVKSTDPKNQNFILTLEAEIVNQQNETDIVDSKNIGEIKNNSDKLDKK
ncbi:MAG: DUF1573 domain-containing protein [Prevotellaceae bacterium]|jgi:hypothetical protein|nr:DUF1573 domain-containing protein [Prevotellaceae bacterium]